MKKFVLLVTLFLPAFLHAQGVPYAVNPPAPNAQITVCGAPAVGANPCTNTVPIYTTSALSTQITQPAQVGPTGNYTFFYSPQSIIVQITGRPDQFVGGGGANGSGINPLGASFNVKVLGAIGDAKKTITAVTANGSASVTDATNTPWLASDVGKKIFCIGQAGAGENSTFAVSIATIATFVNSGSITVNTTGNGLAGNPSYCVWFTQKETSAFQAASTAATQALKAVKPSLGVTLAYPSTVYAPCGGYVIDGPFFIQNNAYGNALGANFQGGGKGCTIFYVSPDVAVSNGGWIISDTSSVGFTFADFTVDCSMTNLAVTSPGAFFNTTGHWNLRNVEFAGCGSTGDNSGILAIQNNTQLIADEVSFNNAPVTPVGSHEPPIVISGSASITFRNLYTTNPSPQPITITTSGSTSGANAGGPRSLLQNTVTFENSIMDEGATPGCVSITQSSVNFIGVTCMEGATTGVSVDANSSLYMQDSLIAPFNGGCSGGTRQALTIATTGYVYATGSDFEGCGSDGTGLSAAVKGTSAGTFVSAGGNTWRTCTGSVPCPLVTAANYGTLAFNGGIIPKSSETHTPNTCYAATGTLVQTQNLCTFLNDQNYQVINITAQSGGNAPANSSCTVAPVVTLSDGTRTATLTLTTGKTQWASNVDASTVNSIFATGTTLTISVGTFTCATPPTNLAVSYVLQSVLNP